MQIPNALIQAVREYLECRASEEALQPIDDKIQRELLAKMQISHDPQWAAYGDGSMTGPITNPEESYLMGEEDAVRYFAALDAAWRAAGFTDMPEGYSPYLMAHNKRIEAEAAVLDAAVMLHGKPQLSSENLYLPSHRKEALEFTLRFVTPRLGRAA